MKSRIYSSLVALAASAMSAIGFGGGAIAKASPLPVPKSMKVYEGGSSKGGNKWRMKYTQVLRDWVRGKAMRPHPDYNLAERYRQRYSHMLTSTMTGSDTHGAFMNCHKRRRMMEKSMNPMMVAKTTRQARQAAAQ